MSKVKVFFITAFILCIPVYGFSLEDQYLSQELEHCLTSNWGIDNNTSKFLYNKFRPLLDNPRHHVAVKEFIRLSKEVKLNFSSDKKLVTLSQDDGIYASPKEHLVIFENQ